MTAAAIRPDRPLAGKKALVTGAARGLGRAYGTRLALLGASVAVTDVNLRSYEDFQRERETMTEESTAAEIRAAGGEAREYQLDVTDQSAVEEVFADVLSSWGQIDIVVCNAGGGSGAMPDSAASVLKPDDLEAVMYRNFFGTVNTVRPAALAMKSSRSGKIITVSSTSGLSSSPDGTYAHYGSAKAAIAMYTRYLARDLGPYGVTANCIAPGMTGTGRMMEKFEAIGIENVVSGIPLRRLGRVDDIAKVVEFLATDLSDYVNGAVIPVDGGFLA